ncbi:UNVERIFIED_CONTAM: hypothetical protein Sradi_5060400 [Sesamum radiatum]|uniref:MULE transposase domain-containing protein n=1 Tax=Sesamum radiatum TaxID=300843 RepID=A0AAW2M4H7_SESRA
MMFPINTDEDVQLFFSPMSGYKTVEVFVEAEKVYQNIVADDSYVGDRGTYMSILTEDPHSLPAVTQAMGTVGINEDYAGPSTFHQQDDEYSEPEADSFLNHDPVDSEPEEFENNQDGQNDNNPEEDDDDDGDDVTIAVMLEVLGNNGNEPSSYVQEGIDLNIPASSGPPSLYPIIPFFSTTHPEVAADSYDISSSSWGHFYDSNSGELEYGMVFKSKARLKASVQDFSVRFARREFRVVESKPKLWKVVCKYDEATGCNWMLRAGFKAKMELFKITKYVGPHTCLMNEISIDHRNLGKSMIATHLLGMVRQDPSYDIKYVQQNVKDRFGFDISYHKAWHALKAAREEVYGTWESSVRKLPKYMAALQKWNPGTVVEWLHLDTDRPRRKMLNYVFWAFRPCIEGFRYCRNLISIDGTHLYTKYKHKLLIAVTLDANQQVLPLAFALVDEESLESWRWFMDMLAKHLMLGDDDRICLISDRHSGIISAINFVPAFQFPRGVHHFCLRHICSNFNKKFNNIQLKDLCWRAGAEQNVRKFDRILEEIRG